MIAILDRIEAGKPRIALATQDFEQRRVCGKEHHNVHKFNSENYLSQTQKITS